MQEHVPPGDLNFYQKAFGSKRCIVWHLKDTSHPVQHPRQALQKPHTHVPSSLWSAVRAVALPWTKGKGRLEATGVLGPRSPWNRGCPTFCVSGAAAAQLMGQGERNRGVTMCLLGTQLRTPSRRVTELKWNSFPGSRHPASPQPALQLWIRALLS